LYTTSAWCDQVFRDDGAADESGSEVLFTLRRGRDMTDAEFKADADAVLADLARLEQILEASAVR
jgi:hypothetical protein